MNDPLPEIVQIVRDAISDGLISEPLDRFNTQVRLLKGNELEDYVQTVWDMI